jgi:23S rRNA (uridine2552-2'-O)-methyltransferase
LTVHVKGAKGNTWDDHYARRARKEHWLARSVYKLEEIDKKHRLIRPGDLILDLGCYPGSWSQYCLRRVGPHGEVVGVDLKEPDRLSGRNFRYIQADILDLEAERLRDEIGSRDVVLSDLAPQTSGIRVADATRSLRLAEAALRVGLSVLRKDGRFLCKIFEGAEIQAFRKEVFRHFRQGRTLRPAAVRKASREVYLLGLGLVDQRIGEKENLDWVRQ